MQDFARSSSRSMSWPKTSAVPPVLLTSEVTMPISVVLPAPLGPNNAKKSPSSTSSSTPHSACTPFLYVLVSARVESASMLYRDHPFVLRWRNLAYRAPGQQLQASQLRLAQ